MTEELPNYDKFEIIVFDTINENAPSKYQT